MDDVFIFVSPFRALRKNPSARERPPLVTLQKTRKAGGEAYMVRGAREEEKGPEGWKSETERFTKRSNRRS